MPDYSSNSTYYRSRDLCSKIPFETYSDAKLAALFLDNMEDFSVYLFQQVINVITDPQFKPSELTLKDIWGIFDRVSTHRKSSVLDRAVAKPHKVETTSGVVPPLVLGLVVDEIAQQNTPFTMLAENTYWEDAFARNRTDLFNMSLVHRSWTEIAHKGMRRRAIIPYQQINRFLLSPFCGPWVKEMIIYWMPDYSDVVSLSDIELLENLFARTPNVHSLAFNTALSPCRRYYTGLEVPDCLDTIAYALSDLRHLWLNHFQRVCGHEPECGSGFEPCYELESLYATIPKMRTLEFLSIKGWSDSEEDALDWKEQPPSSLKAVELSIINGAWGGSLAWLLRPRGNFILQSVSIWWEKFFIPKLYRKLESLLRSDLHLLERLSISLGTGSDWRNDRSISEDLLLNCSRLTSLELYYGQEPCTVPHLPSSLEHLTIHCLGNKLEVHWRESGPNWLVQALIGRVSLLPRLQSFLFIFHTESSVLRVQDDVYKDFKFRSSCRLYDISRLVNAGLVDRHLSENLTNLCRDQNIRLECITAEPNYF